MFYQVFVNGIRQYCAGFDCTGALVANVTFQDIRPEANDQHTGVTAYVMGVSKDKGVLSWPLIPLVCGDEVTIRIVERAEADDPVKVDRLPGDNTHIVSPDS